MTDRGGMKFENVAGDAPVDTIGKGPKRDLPVDFETVNGLIDHMTRYVRDYWLGEDARDKDDAKKQFLPMVTAVCANGDIVPMMIGTNFDEDSKDDLVEMCQINFNKWGVVRYVFASEAWLASYEGDAARAELDKKDRLPPSQVESRVEVMTIQAVDRDGTHAFAALEMVRDWSTGLVTDLKEFQIERAVPPDMRKPGSQMQFKGRFSTLMDPHVPPKNPLLDAQNQQMIKMFSTVLNPPEEMLRERYKSLGKDHKPIFEAGKKLLADMQSCWDMMEKAETVAEQRAILDVLNKLNGDAQKHLMKVLLDGGITPPMDMQN